jgi:alkanesulfonate monooxygenase SsuD/methylene tetrahydromethanopterin reductase-like flavin-dependent oxidoreductase (luciferase family)
MQFTFQRPERHGPDSDLVAAGPVGEVAQAAVRAGFHGFSLTEHPAPRWLASGGHQSLDPFIALGQVAAVTERPRLLTCLSVAPYRNPFLPAKAAATLDRLCGDRFTLGLGAGSEG